jgi:hypothetical protein
MPEDKIIFLEDIANLKEEEGEWFEFNEIPEVKSFEIKIRFLSPKDDERIADKHREFRGGRFKWDREGYTEHKLRFCVKDWRGLTRENAERIIPNLAAPLPREIKEIPFCFENLLFLYNNSHVFRDWLDDIMTNETAFKTIKKKKN